MNVDGLRSDKVAVHCKTEKEAKDFIKIAYDNWVEWYRDW